MSEIETLKNTIQTIESQRSSLGDAAVDPVLEGLNRQLAELEEQEQKRQLAIAAQSTGGDRRIVTVLICDVVSSTAMAEKMDPEAWTEIMDEAFGHFSEPISRFEGNIIQFMGDGLLAFFGAPKAHEDDPQRAVMAGLAILENIQDLRGRVRREYGLDFNVRIGINSGLVVTSHLRSHGPGEFQALGEGYRVAAVMERSADPGTVRVADHTYKLTALYFDYEPQGTVNVPGKRRAVRVFRALRPRKTRGKRKGLQPYGITFPLTGREEESEAGWAAVSQLLFGRGGFLYICGEAGIGKSRLIDELQQHSQGPDLIWLNGRSLFSAQNISYRPFQEMLRQYANIYEEDNEERAWQKLERAVRALFPRDIAEILPYLAGLIGMEARGIYAERVKFLDGEAMRDQILVATQRFWERLAEVRPYVLVFEDLHWIDASSAGMLKSMLKLLPYARLLIIGLGRPDLNRAAAELQQEAISQYGDFYQEILLGPLSEVNSRKLVSTLLADDARSVRTKEMVVRIADGNPFFMEEILRDLIEEGAITPAANGRHWQPTRRMDTLHIPNTVQGVITARIDRLDDGPKRVLRAAAVIGPAFQRNVLSAVLGSEQDLDAHLAQLQTAELVGPVENDQDVTYIFKSALAQEVTYSNTLLQKRRELHLKVGQVMETIFADRLEDFYGLLAYHFAQAEAWESAQKYLLKAGDQAGLVAAGVEALDQYQRALLAYEHAMGETWDNLQRAEVQRKMGEAYYSLGRLPESREYFQNALQLLDRPLPQTRRSLFVALTRQIIRQSAHRLFPRLFLGRAGQTEVQALREAVRCYDHLGIIYYIQGEAASSIYASLRALNLGEPAGPSPELARAYANSLIAAGLMPPLRFMADRYAQLALETAQHEQDLAAQAWVHQLVAINNTGQARWAEAIEAAEVAMQLNERIGRLRWLEECTGVLGQTLHYHGEFNRSLELYRRMIKSATKRGDEQTQIWGLAGQCETYLRLGGSNVLQEIDICLERCQELLGQYRYRNRPDEIQVFSLMAQLALRRGEWIKAYRAARQVTELIAVEWPPSTFYSFEAYAGLPEVYLTLLEAQKQREFRAPAGDDLPEQAGQAVRDLRNFSRVFPFARPRAVLWQGCEAWSRGKERQARRTWEKSLKQAQRLDMPYDEGQAHLALGRYLPAGHPACIEHLEEAIRIFSELGAGWDLAQAQGAL